MKDIITLYYCGKCGSCLKTKTWLENQGLNVKKKKISEISEEDLFLLLALTDRGLEEIIKFKGKWNRQNLQSSFHFNEWTLTECVQFLIYHTEFLQCPIIIDQTKYMTGYNPDDIRKFLPKSRRKIERVIRGYKP